MKASPDDQTSFITYLRCLQSLERAGKDLSRSRGEQGGEQSHAAGDGKSKWKAVAYHSHLIDFLYNFTKVNKHRKGKVAKKGR